MLQDSNKRESSITIERGSIQLKTWYFDISSSSVISKVVMIDCIPQPFFGWDYDTNLRNEHRNKMCFNSEAISDFQIFYQNYGIFPENMQQGPKKILCNAEDVVPILIHDVILFSLFNSVQCDNESKKRKFVQKNLCSTNIYLSLKPRNEEEQSVNTHYIYDLIMDGFLTLFQIFRSDFFESKFPIDRPDILTILFIDSDHILLDSHFNRYVCLLEAEKLASVNFTVHRVTLDNCSKTNFGNGFMMKNWIGPLNFVPFCCLQHSHFNFDGKLLNQDYDEVFFLSVYPGVEGIICPACVLKHQNKRMSLQSMKEFYNSYP